jgi:hypothetical protein
MQKDSDTATPRLSSVEPAASILLHFRNFPDFRTQDEAQLAPNLFTRKGSVAPPL